MFHATHRCIQRGATDAPKKVLAHTTASEKCTHAGTFVFALACIQRSSRFGLVYIYTYIYHAVSILLVALPSRALPAARAEGEFWNGVW